MKIFFDTSILVEIDRQNKTIIDFLKNLVKKKNELLISTITIGEILTGTYLRRDIKEATIKAKEVLNQFIWKDVDGETAEIIAKLISYLILEKKEGSIEYPDILIVASFFSSNCDAFITLNKKDFILFPQLKDFVYKPEEFEKSFPKLFF